MSYEPEKSFPLHESYLNTQMVRVLRTIGFNRTYVRAEGPYLFDESGNRYLDLLSGFGVFGMGRNHPKIKEALKNVLDQDLPDLVQMDCSYLAGVLAEELIRRTPYELDKAFFCNSGTEAIEAAIKFARAATARTRLLYCEHAFHGLSYGALSLNGDKIFKEKLGPFLGDCDQIPFNDLEALEEALSKRDVAAFFVEPIQGKGVNVPSPGYFKEVSRLCKKYGSLFVADEIQSGLGRTGRFYALEHEEGVEPDMITVAKALSGGFVPVGALLTRKWIFDKLFSRMDKSVVHGSTFGKNNLAMTAALATLRVLDEEKLVKNAAEKGEKILSGFRQMKDRYEFVKDVRGRGLMIGVEFGSPKSLKLKTGWKLLDTANKGLFCQMVTIPLFKEFRILSQVAGHQSYVVKLLPPYVISDSDVEWILDAFDKTISETHRFPGAIWDLARSLAGHAIRQ